MRPIKLTMAAFGPYAGREVVDFRDVVTSGLFGIYGPPGSGKSTIFSAMTFALFGEASRSEQEPGSQRSDHATANTLKGMASRIPRGTRAAALRRIRHSTRAFLSSAVSLALSAPHVATGVQCVCH
jgi:exonuclease SbcC